eukprot:TRINITY_DN8018_c0_g3_i1.p2 TRINITY_DN8018_c0_g3~~TRINITY_DN8018_c0_g3_i1.p2  ORF type:complete len:120 (-),score=5.88 TRINITY_DN8018_c0_g3_i1:1501-1860(-)
MLDLRKGRALMSQHVVPGGCVDHTALLFVPHPHAPRSSPSLPRSTCTKVLRQVRQPRTQYTMQGRDRHPSWSQKMHVLQVRGVSAVCLDLCTCNEAKFILCDYDRLVLQRVKEQAAGAV